MKIDAFLTCLSSYNISTGASDSLEGAYSLTSGTTGIFFNQLYSSGFHFVNSQVYAPTLPLINIYGNRTINSGIFSGNNGLRIGYSHTGNFGIIMDIEYSGCNRPNNQRSMVLLSTANSPYDFNSGFVVGITESHRLYLSTSGYSTTMDKELSTREFVYISTTENRYLSIGTYNFDDDTLYKQNVTLPSGVLGGGNIYIGNFLRGNDSSYTGFSGIINQVILFGDSITDTDVGICANCSLATGFVTGSSIFSYSGWQLTGVDYSGLYDYVVTGYANITGHVVSHDGSTINVIISSGMTGYLETGILASPAFSGIVLEGTRDYTVFQYDTAALNSLSTFSIYFNSLLSSGDTIELYSYPKPNTNIGKKIDGLVWPIETGYIQLVANGLNETPNVDYAVVRNEISGFFFDDILSYDVLPENAVVTAYSGYWNDASKLQMSGGGFFPSAPQYFENANFTGIVKITGLRSICTGNPFFPRFGYNLHMNGQKLISGMHYDVVSSGAAGFVVLLSGKNLPQLSVGGVYDITGGGPIDIDFVDDNELAFIPEFSGKTQTRIDISTDGRSYGNFTGFSEQVWVNGIRQLRHLDYIKISPCSLITGVFNPPIMDFVMYDSDGTDTMWNMQLPPAVTGISGDGSTQTMLMNWNGLAVRTGSIFEVYSRQLINSTTFGSPIYNGFMSSWSYAARYTGHTSSSVGSGILLVRYHNDNMASEWFQSTGFSIYNS